MTNGDMDDDPFSANTFEVRLSLSHSLSPSLPHSLCTQSVSEFSPVVVGRKVLENLHRTEVLLKNGVPQ